MQFSSSPESETGSPLRVMSLHALLYCERLFYLEEVEEIRVADASVYAGRRLHEERLPLGDESNEKRSMEVASESLGLIGKVDAVRKRDGRWIAYEHKRGRCKRGENKAVMAWPSDRVQAIAYAVLLSEVLSEDVSEARVRYHADNVTAIIAVDDAAIAELKLALAKARHLRSSTSRPPVTSNENLCIRCSLAPVCLPEEERLSAANRGHPTTSLVEIATANSPVDHDRQSGEFAESSDCNDEVPPQFKVVNETEAGKPPRLFPARRQKQTLHVTAYNARIGRNNETLTVTFQDGQRIEHKQVVAIADIDSIIIHGFGQISTQAVHLCAYHGISVQWMSAGGKFIASTANSPGRVQQRIRQYAALQDKQTCLRLAQTLVHAKVEMQLRYLLRCTRGGKISRTAIAEEIQAIRNCLREISRSKSLSTLLGYEGTAARAYFASVPSILSPSVPTEMVPKGRSKYPPRDRFNALLSFGYAMLFGLVERCMTSVGLEPSFGFYHQPRSSAPPLVLDVMELFRTNIWEIPLVGSVNRMQWDTESDFTVTSQKVWLSDAGRKKAIALFEQRLGETYVHPHTRQSLEYGRMVELELRLLEKEWTGYPGLFAKLRLR